MLNNIRNFAKTKSAGVLVGILIVPFVLWGMGGVFSGGNKNNIAKINNESISTVNFQNYLNSSNIGLDRIKENIEKNIIEEILGEVISKKMLSMEIEDLNLIFSDEVLNKKIKKDKNFFDENNKFSRIKYEKFLLSNNLVAPIFEFNLRQKELQKNLFNYIAGGLHTPKFLVNNYYKDQTKKITVSYINLNNFYRKEDSFSNDEISKFIEENKEDLKKKIVSFKYAEITPNSLIGLNEFNNLFFEKIDEIENEILNGSTFENIKNKFNLDQLVENNFEITDKPITKEYYKNIYEGAETKKIELIEKNDFYVLYEITDIQKILPKKNNKKFIEKIKKILFNQSKFNFNKDLIKKIGEKTFDQNDFEKLSNNNLMQTKVQSINDNDKFDINSVKYLYTKTKNDFALITDDDKNIYLIKIVDLDYDNILMDSNNFTLYKKQTNDKIRSSIYNSYDLFLNTKYNIKINEKTLERVKNYFR